MSDQSHVAVAMTVTAPDSAAVVVPDSEPGGPNGADIADYGDAPRESGLIDAPAVAVAAPPVNPATVIPIASVGIGQRRRALREDTLAGLVESISQIGVQQPITVAQVADGEAPFALIAGRHRLEACRRLEIAMIPAIVVTMHGDERALWEIDENLCRAELTELERGEHLLDRKSIYERLHPKTRQHVAGAHAANAAMSRGDATADSAVASFGADTAKKTGIAPRTLRQSISRANKISKGARDRIRGKLEIADNGSELDALGSLPPEDQERAISLVEDKTYRDIKAAKRSLNEASGAGPAAAGKRLRRTELAPDQSSAPFADDQHRELFELLFKAAIFREVIPDVKRMESLLRHCHFDHYADQYSRHVLAVDEAVGSKAA